MAGLHRPEPSAMHLATSCTPPRRRRRTTHWPRTPTTRRMHPRPLQSSTLSANSSRTDQPICRGPGIITSIHLPRQIGGSARVIHEQAKSQKVTLSWAPMRPDRVVHLDAERPARGPIRAEDSHGRARTCPGHKPVPGRTPGLGSRTCSLGRFAAWLAGTFTGEGQARRAGRLVCADGGERSGEGADVVAAVVGVQGYPDAAVPGTGADVVLAGQRCLHVVGGGRRVPE